MGEIFIAVFGGLILFVILVWRGLMSTVGNITEEADKRNARLRREEQERWEARVVDHTIEHKYEDPFLVDANGNKAEDYLQLISDDEKAKIRNKLHLADYVKIDGKWSDGSAAYGDNDVYHRRKKIIEENEKAFFDFVMKVGKCSVEDEARNFINARKEAKGNLTYKNLYRFIRMAQIGKIPYVPAGLGFSYGKTREYTKNDQIMLEILKWLDNEYQRFDIGRMFLDHSYCFFYGDKPTSSRRLLSTVTSLEEYSSIRIRWDAGDHKSGESYSHRIFD